MLDSAERGDHAATMRIVVSNSEDGRHNGLGTVGTKCGGIERGVGLREAEGRTSARSKITGTKRGKAQKGVLELKGSCSIGRRSHTTSEQE